MRVLNDYVSANNVSTALSGIAEYTISVWCKPVSKSGGHSRRIILAFNNPSSGDFVLNNRATLLYDYNNNKFAYGDEQNSGTLTYKVCS